MGAIHTPPLMPMLPQQQTPTTISLQPLGVRLRTTETLITRRPRPLGALDLVCTSRRPGFLRSSCSVAVHPSHYQHHSNNTSCSFCEAEEMRGRNYFHDETQQGYKSGCCS